jgi:magnesium-transporting ATPase (P-type)
MITLFDKRDKSIREFRIVRNIKFTTVRRQQTMILYDMKDENIIAFTKGADEAIFPKAKDDQIGLQKMQEDCSSFASEGQRTLVYAYKYLTPGINEDINELFASLEAKDEMDIEQDFTVIGLTGFEDKLQEGVYDCLKDFTEAGIKTWIVTGDKGETARSIGY